MYGLRNVGPIAMGVAGVSALVALVHAWLRSRSKSKDPDR
jgi:hypothetical protein